MDTLLTPLGEKNDPGISEANSAPVIETRQRLHDVAVSDPISALEVLKSRPDIEDLTKTLHWLYAGSKRKNDFNITKPSPRATQIIFVLVNEILPNFWELLSAEGPNRYSKTRVSLIQCLKCVAGVGAIVSRLRSVLLQSKGSQSKPNDRHPVDDLLHVIESVLEGEATIASIWWSIHENEDSSTQKSLQWKELISIVTSGRLLSVCSEACQLSDGGLERPPACSWIGDGSRYSAWLGRNIASVNTMQNGVESHKAFAQLLGKALSLGYTG